MSDTSRDPDFDLAAAIRDELAELDTSAACVPPAVDEAVLMQARQQFETIRRRRRLVRWGWLPPAAAACVTALLWYGSTQPPRPIEDINRDGHVNILDAYTLARKLNVDVNGDGRVDDVDVDLVAARAVALWPQKEVG